MVHRVSLGDIAEHEVCPRRYYLGRTGAERLRSTTSILNGAILTAVDHALLGLETSNRALTRIGELEIDNVAGGAPPSTVRDIRLGLSSVEGWVADARRRWARIMPRLLTERAYTALLASKGGESLQRYAAVRVGPASEVRLRPFVVSYGDDGAIVCSSWLADVVARESADDPALLMWAGAMYPDRKARIVRYWLDSYQAERVPPVDAPPDVGATVAKVQELAARLELGAAAFPTLEDDAKPCRRCAFRPACRGEVPRG